MKVLVVSDVHGNLPALEAVFEDAEYDVVACVGDVIGVLGWVEEVAQELRNYPCVYGNHDAYFREDFSWVPSHPAQKQEHRVVSTQMSPETQDWLNSLPEERTESYDGVSLHLVHANPFADRLLDQKWGEYKCGYPASGYCGKKYYVKVGSFVDADYVALGHTHEQAKLDTSKFGHDTVVFNPGSVGVPWHESAKYAVLDTNSGVELCSVEYDTDALEERFEFFDITTDGDK